MRRGAVQLAAVSLLLVTGCWSRVEVTDLGVATGMAVDVGENAPVRVTLFLARSPGAQTEGQHVGGDPKWVVARDGPTISEAIRAISMAASRRISLHHMRAVLVGERYANRDMSDLVDFLSRSPEIRLTTRVFVVQGSAQAAMETPPHLEALQPENVAEILQAKGGPQPRLKELMISRAAQTASGWLYSLRVTDQSVLAAGPQTPDVEVSGAALLRSDRVVKILDPALMRALEWLDGNPKQLVFTASCPNAPDKHLSVRVIDGSAKITPQVTGKKVSFLVRATGTVEVTNTECNLNVVTPASRSALETSLEAEVSARMQQLISVLQQTGTDPAAFGKRVQLHAPAYWRTIETDWPQVWPQASVKTESQITIRDAGLLTEPVNRTRLELEQRKD